MAAAVGMTPAPDTPSVPEGCRTAGQARMRESAAAGPARTAATATGPDLAGQTDPGAAAGRMAAAAADTAAVFVAGADPAGHTDPMTAAAGPRFPPWRSDRAAPSP